MSVSTLRVVDARERIRMPLGVPATSAVAAATGALLGSVPTIVVALAPLAVWVVVYAPETLLVLLASQGTLKAVLPFTALPVDLLYVSLGLVGVASALRIREGGLPPFASSSVLMVVLAVLLLAAAISSSSRDGGTYKAVYFEVVCGTLFFAPMVLVRDAAGLGRLAAAFVIVGLLVAHAASPGSSPGQPYTLPGGNEITAAFFPAVGALAALTCLSMRSLGIRRLLAFSLFMLLAAAAVRAGSRGVLVAILISGLLALALIVIHANRPVLALGLTALAVTGVFVGGTELVGSSAQHRYSALTSDPRRDFLRTRALDQAIDHPLGSGIGAFAVNLPVLNPRPRVPYPHNIVLEVFNESGVLALAKVLSLKKLGQADNLRATRGRIMDAFDGALQVFFRVGSCGHLN